jgi:ABC-type polysaccharide transport system permease subunit
MPRKHKNRKYPLLNFTGVFLEICGFFYIFVVFVFFVATAYLQGSILDQLFGDKLPKFYQDVALFAHFLIMISAMTPGLFFIASGELTDLLIAVAKDIEYMANESEMYTHIYKLLRNRSAKDR